MRYIATKILPPNCLPMKKLASLFLLFSIVFASAQSAEEVQRVMNSTNMQQIAAFIKKYPHHDKTPALQAKLISLVKGGSSSYAKPKVETLTPKKLENKVAAAKPAAKYASSKNPTPAPAHVKRTEDVLNHLMNSTANSSEAYVLIKNASKCDMMVKFSGRKFYNLTVPARNENYVLINKGNYTLSTSVCDAKYNSKKNITKDLIITLGQ